MNILSSIGNILGTIIEWLGIIISIAYNGALLGFVIYMIYLLFFGERREEAWLSILQGIVGIFFVTVLLSAYNLIFL